MKVVICGAGIAGLTLANGLSALGGEVMLLERAPGPRSQGYMIDFFGPGYDAVEAMGLLPEIEDVAYHVEEASLVDEHGRRRAGVRPEPFVSGIREGVVFAPFHYGYFDQEGGHGPDGHARAANELTITEWDPVSKQPLLKVGAVKVTKVAAAGREPSLAPTTTASAPAKNAPGGPRPEPTVGGRQAEVAETVKEG